MDFTKAIQAMPGFLGSGGRGEKTIAEAEKKLGISFAPDYRAYLKEIGLACFDGHELTGVTETTRLDVISVTQEQRRQFGGTTASWYVVEDVGLDGILIWQSPDGTVYAAAPDVPPKKIANSLSEYFEKQS
mgnify:FL=1